MSTQNGNIGAEYAKEGATVLVEKGYLYSGNIDKALTPERISTELAGIEIPENSTVWKVVMANTTRDRHNEVIPQPILQKFAEQINKDGLSLNFLHDRSYIIGRVLPRAIVQPMQGGGYELIGYIAVYDKAAMPTQTTDGKGISINSMMKDKSIKDVSSEFMGRSNYVSPETGSARGHWEYFVDPERPEETEITGLAVVPKGAQRGASVVKSLEGKENPKTENMSTVFTDKAVGAGKKFPLELADGKLKGLDAIEKELDDLHNAKSAAETAKTKAETDLATEKAAQKPVFDKLIADIENFGKLIGETHKAEDLQKLTLKEAFEKREEVLKKHDEQNAPKKAAEAKKGNDDGQPKAFFTVTAKTA